MSVNQSVLSCAITSDERIRNVLRRLIKKAYDKHEFTRASLSQESGVNIHQIDAIVSRDVAKHRRVAAEDALCLAYTLGEEAVAALVGTINYTATHQDAEETSPAHLIATILPHVSTIAAAAADGRFDHIEMPGVRDAADGIIATVLPLSSAGEGA